MQSIIVAKKKVAKKYIYICFLILYTHTHTHVCVCAHLLSHVQLFATSWIIFSQASFSMEFSRQGSWSWLPFPTLGDLPDPGMKPVFLVSPKLAGGLFTTVPPGKPIFIYVNIRIYVICKYYVFMYLSLNGLVFCSTTTL